jgi:hypothetical protein
VEKRKGWRIRKKANCGRTGMVGGCGIMEGMEKVELSGRIV